MEIGNVWLAGYDSPRSDSSAHSTPGTIPAVALLGPRQVGKTTLALSLTNEAENSPLYLDLELPSDRAKLADPELYLSDYEDRLVILDEIHRLPGIFQTLRGLLTGESEKGNAPASSYYSDRPQSISCSNLRRRLRAESPIWS